MTDATILATIRGAAEARAALREARKREKEARAEGDAREAALREADGVVEYRGRAVAVRPFPDDPNSIDITYRGRVAHVSRSGAGWSAVGFEPGRWREDPRPIASGEGREAALEAAMRWAVGGRR